MKIAAINLNNKEILDLLQENWSNDACMGYTLAALKNLSFNQKDIKKILIEMVKQFDILSVEDAAEIYHQANL